MDVKAIESLMPELESFVSRYLSHFGRVQNHAHAMTILQGLLAGGDRRNVENMAETIEGGVVRTLQKFIAQAIWSDQDVLAELRQHVCEALGEDDGLLIVDETGFPKKGKQSVGVARQYSGTLGRVDNCQVGVFVSYCSSQGETLIDRRLFLPEQWIIDEQRLAQAGVPSSVIFRSKPELASEMIQQAIIEGVPFQWVCGDSIYGTSPVFVQTVRELGKWYVVETSCDARVWTTKPKLRLVGQTTRRGGRPTKNAKPLKKPRRVDEVVANLPASAWKRMSVAEGSQGPRLYEYAEITVWFSEQSRPTDRRERLLVRRSVGQDSELKYQRSNAPAEIPLKKLAEVGGSRWCIEKNFQSGKGECGLDEYETRGWIGWHHHTCLSMLALLFLTLQKQRLGKKTSGPDCSGSPQHSQASAIYKRLDPGSTRRMESMANRPQPDRKTLPRTKKKKRTTKTH